MPSSAASDPGATTEIIPVALGTRSTRRCERGLRTGMRASRMGEASVNRLAIRGGSPGNAGANEGPLGGKPGGPREIVPDNAGAAVLRALPIDERDPVLFLPSIQ